MDVLLFVTSCVKSGTVEIILRGAFPLERINVYRGCVVYLISSKYRLVILRRLVFLVRRRLEYGRLCIVPLKTVT